MDRISKSLIPALLVLLLVGLLALTGCNKPAAESDSAERSQEVTLGEFPESGPPEVQVPPEPLLDTPRNAVGSYLAWISFAYRMLNSDVATPAMSVWEEVGVTSYVELLKSKDKALDQRLMQFDVKETQTKGSTATITAREYWKYRYIYEGTQKYTGDVNEATYDTTYTIVQGEDGNWRVDDVVAAPVGAQPK